MSTWKLLATAALSLGVSLAYSQAPLGSYKDGVIPQKTCPNGGTTNGVGGCNGGYTPPVGPANSAPGTSAYDRETQNKLQESFRQQKQAAEDDYLPSLLRDARSAEDAAATDFTGSKDFLLKRRSGFLAAAKAAIEEECRKSQGVNCRNGLLSEVESALRGKSLAVIDREKRAA